MELRDLEKIKETQPGMKHAKMLFKHPGPHKFGKDGMFDYCVVDMCNEKALNMLLEAGWKLTIQGAKKKDSAVEKAAVSKLKCDKEIAEEATAEEAKDPEKDESPSEDPEKVEADDKIKTAKARLHK